MFDPSLTVKLKTTDMENQLNNIIELAANLIIKGEATEENAITMAIQIDNEKCLKCIEDVSDMNRGYTNEHNKTQKAHNIILKSVYNKLS